MEKAPYADLLSDVDECQENADLCGANAGVCENLMYLGYNCSCFAGFKFMADVWNKNVSCEDINECLASNKPCGALETCVNGYGNFSCECHVGFERLSMSENCSDVNECLTTCMEPNMVCSNDMGSFSCSCILGFELDVNNQECVDVDECGTGAHDCLEVDRVTCSNVQGTFVCGKIHFVGIIHTLKSFRRSR